ncbi:MAG: hypothetical protein M3153_00200 [Chloroflexota bacterium]|nr:hypothetical protein [Chloroflexota bacterium]
MRALLTATMLTTLVACGDTPASEPGPGEEETAAGGWQPLPASPLSARTGAHAFWNGSSVLVIGGSDDDSCPPNADCVVAAPPLSDGAAYDPSTGTWSPLPDAPVPLGHLTGAVIGDTLYVWVSGIQGAAPAFLSLTAGDDAWLQLDPPPAAQDEQLSLVAAGDRLVAFHTSQELGVAPDLIFDPDPGVWSELPLDPLTPAFDRSMVWIGDAMVLLGRAVVPNPGSERPSLVEAARFEVDTQRWDRFSDSTIVGGSLGWSWTDGRLVNPEIGSSDGGEVNNWGRPYPHGGMLNPAKGEWTDLPPGPEAPGPYPGVSTAGPEWTVSAAGWALHVPSGRWIELPRPGAGAADFGQAITWAGDGMFMWGGARSTDIATVLLDEGWTWIPPSE